MTLFWSSIGRYPGIYGPPLLVWPGVGGGVCALTKVPCISLQVGAVEAPEDQVIIQLVPGVPDG